MTPAKAEEAACRKTQGNREQESKAPGANPAPEALGSCLSESFAAQDKRKLRLPENQLVVSTAVGSTAAVKTSTAMKAAAIAAVKTSAASVKAAASIAAETATICEAATETVLTGEPATEAASVEAASTAPEPISGPAIKAASVEAAAIIAASIEAATVVAVKPGAGADKHAAYKVVRPVIAIGRAGIRVVAIITVGAHRRRSKACGVHRTYSNAHGNLCPRVSCGKEQNAQQCSIFEVSHILASYPARKPCSTPKRAGTLPGNLAWGSGLHSQTRKWLKSCTRLRRQNNPRRFAATT
jgi:hypothetical protein